MYWFPYCIYGYRFVSARESEQAMTTAAATVGRRAEGRVWKQIKRSWQLYLFLALPLIWLLVFMYYPMYGAQIAFRDFLPGQSIMGSEWIGFANFIRFFESPLLSDLFATRWCYRPIPCWWASPFRSSSP